MRSPSTLLGIALLLTSSSFGIAGTRTITLAVDKMVCSLCPITVKKSISAVRGVSNVTVSFNKKNAVVTFDDTRTNVQALINASTNAGFPARIKTGVNR